MRTLFISDVHLDKPDSLLTDAMFRFIETVASNAQALYILGDLFESYVGDDENALLHQLLSQKLTQLHQQGTAVYLLNGNHDFMVGQAYAQRCHATLLPEPYLADLYGTPTLLLHGDSLCIHDKTYQRLRKVLQNHLFQWLALKCPLSLRFRIAASLRKGSHKMMHKKPPSIMDVAQEAVEQILLEHGVNRMIHGHTHQPAIHDFTLQENMPGQRIVLGAWDSHPKYLEVTPDNVQLNIFHLKESASHK